MNELYCVTQLIKAHPRHTLDAFQLQQVYRRLGHQDLLNRDSLLKELHMLLPETAAYLEKNHRLYSELLSAAQGHYELGVKFVCYGEAHYPAGCYLMEDPPLSFSYMGAPAWQEGKSLAVVGSREPQRESLEWMEQEFSKFCESEKAVIVSGGARGVDQKSHSISLRKQVPTLIILPSGLGNLYPDSLKDWVHPVMDQGGCLISEYDFQQRMHKYLFHHRNRLIAALGRATLIVEARRRSGTLITAQQAAQLGRPVWVVPGHPRDPHFQGSLDLLSEGASLVRDAQDLSMFFHSELRLPEEGLVQLGESLRLHPYM